MVEPIAIPLFQLLLKLLVLRLELEILDEQVFDRGGVVGRWEGQLRRLSGSATVVLPLVLIVLDIQ